MFCLCPKHSPSGHMSWESTALGYTHPSTRQSCSSHSYGPSSCPFTVGNLTPWGTHCPYTEDWWMGSLILNIALPSKCCYCRIQRRDGWQSSSQVKNNRKEKIDCMDSLDPHVTYFSFLFFFFQKQSHVFYSWETIQNKTKQNKTGMSFRNRFFSILSNQQVFMGPYT